MADVLLARTDGIEGFARHVVLKRIRAEHAKDQRFIDMFLDEARLAANLHHQNIVQVHDIGESDGEYFFAMEYLHGADLRAMLSIVSKTRTHMPLGYVVSVISSVAAGLHHAHERRGHDKKPLNIVHRDVSPSNILVGYDGSVKVVDFGIAKAAMRQVETRSGSLKGKVSYMSPEQCKMTQVDRRSDIYALGVVLYELATTTRLFKSDSDYLVMDAICTGKIPLPRVRRPDLPNELSTIIMKALATDPERRYQTADEMRVALDAFATQANLTANASTIASYVVKLCGEKPEPWLDSEGGDSPEDMARHSWSDLPVVDGQGATSAGGTRTGTGGGFEAKTITDGKGKRRTPATPLAAVKPVEAPQPDEGGTRTSTKMGWETSGTLPPGPAQRGLTPAKVAMIAGPLFVIAGVLAWKLVASPDKPATATAPAAQPSAASTVGAAITPAAGADKTVDRVTADPTVVATATATAPATNAVAATTKPADAKAVAITTKQPADAKAVATTTKPADAKAVATTTKPADAKAVATTKPADAKAAATTTKPADQKAVAATTKAADPKAVATTKPSDAKAVTATTKPSDPKAVAATTKPVDAKAVAATTKPADPKATATAPATGSAATKPADVKPAITATPAPPAEAPLPALASGVVEGLASRNRKALLGCEGSETLQGELTIRFQVNADGTVAKSTVQSTLNKPKVSNCINATLRSWKFPKAAATGVYAISFQ
jgi:serine/threonine-protein kinase